MSTSNSARRINELSDFLTQSDFRVDWSRRRIIIYVTLTVFALLVTLVHVALLYAVVLSTQKAQPLDLMVGQILGSLVYTDTFILVSVIGSYVFGANFDSRDFRRNIKDIITGNIKSKTAEDDVAVVKTTTTTEASAT